MATRRSVLSVLGAGLVAITLSGCTSFAPVYGGNGPTDLASARFNFAPPTNRTEQIILQRLKIAFPGPATPSDPELKVTAYVGSRADIMSNAFSVARPVPTRVEATVTIVQDGQELFQAQRFTDTAYQGDKLTPNDLASSIGANETAAEAAAESLRAAIMAGYRPGMVVSTPQN